MAVGNRTKFPNGVSLIESATGSTADELNTAPCFAARFDNLAAASDNRLVTSTNMKVGAYTVANSGVAADGFAHQITVTTVAATGADTMGTVVVVGTGVDGQALTETITPVTDAVATGTKFFKTVTSITGAGWVISGGNDTITVGFNAKTAFPFALSAASQVILTTLGTAIVANTVTAGAVGTANFDASAATYDGSKDLVMFIRV